MTPEELKETLESYFASYPKEDELLMTSDGQVFLRKNANDAHNHQLRIDDKKKVEIYHRNGESVYVTSRVSSETVSAMVRSNTRAIRHCSSASASGLSRSPINVSVLSSLTSAGRGTLRSTPTRTRARSNST